LGGKSFVTNNDGTGLLALATAGRLFAPGDGYSYSNAGFSIAGAVIEATSGQPFASFVHKRLLRPLGMRSASFEADRAITYSVAAPHWVADGTAFVIRGGGWQPGWQLDRVDWPAGGLVASVGQLLDWCRFQRTGATADGTVILHRDSLERLHAPVVVGDRIGKQTPRALEQGAGLREGVHAGSAGLPGSAGWKDVVTDPSASRTA
jgi:CubicO group peptidase (beta-lactamase class C family)